MLSAWILVFLCSGCSGTRAAEIGTYATEEACHIAKGVVGLKYTSSKKYIDEYFVCVHNGGK